MFATPFLENRVCSAFWENLLLYFFSPHMAHCPPLSLPKPLMRSLEFNAFLYAHLTIEQLLLSGIWMAISLNVSPVHFLLSHPPPIWYSPVALCPRLPSPPSIPFKQISFFSYINVCPHLKHNRIVWSLGCLGELQDSPYHKR